MPPNNYQIHKMRDKAAFHCMKEHKILNFQYARKLIRGWGIKKLSNYLKRNNLK